MTYFLFAAALLAASALVFLVPPLWGAARKERAISAAMALAFPLAVAAIYLAVGTPRAVSPGQIPEMVGRLAERMRATPQDAEGWIMLGRSYATLGRYSDSALAYERATERMPDDARLLADYADVAAMAQGRRLQGKPEELARRALAADPANVKALSLAGTAAFERADYAAALAEWRKILALVPAGSDIERSVRGSIAQASRNLPAMAIEGRVELSPALARRVRPDDTLFVFARASGERMPRAMLRRRAGDLPLQFRLDDSVSMSPEARLSDARELVVTARISRAGTALPQAGDIEGASRIVRPGASGLVIRIDSETRARP